MNIESKEIVKAIKESGGSISMAAIMLGVSRVTLHKHISQSKELKSEISAIKEARRKERKKTKKIYMGSDRQVGISVQTSETGKLISDRMQEILNNERGKYTSIFNLVIDQLRLREMMEEIEYHCKGKLKEGEEKVSFMEYIMVMSKLHLIYAKLTKAAEEIAAKKIGGKTQAEIYDNVFNFTNSVIETFKEVINDQSIDRGDIIKVFAERIKIRLPDEE